jgi:DNA polymerase-3 subunit epsilon
MRQEQLTGPLHATSVCDRSLPLGADGFLAVDVETANTDPSSICQIAVVRFQRGVAVDIWHSIIDPGEPFAALNVALHGIDETAVANAPNFSQIIEVLSERLSGNVVASHMPFDRIAVQSALTKHCVAPFQCSWLDTASVARRAWPRFARRGYGLKSLAAWCGIDLRHHDAVEDAMAAGLIFSKAMADTGTNVEQWMANLSQPKAPENEG